MEILAKARKFGYDIVEILPISRLNELKNHRRLRVFYHKGLSCVNPGCKRKGTQLAIGIDKKGNQHIDLYDDNFFPMTVDHIIPRSRGGNNDLTNLQPMCATCNLEKGNKLPGETQDVHIYQQSNKKHIESADQFINFGDKVWRKTKGSRSPKFVGIIDDFVVNPHTNLINIMVTGNTRSMYDPKSLIVKK